MEASGSLGKIEMGVMYVRAGGVGALYPVLAISLRITGAHIHNHTQERSSLGAGWPSTIA